MNELIDLWEDGGSNWRDNALRNIGRTDTEQLGPSCYFHKKISNSTG